MSIMRLINVRPGVTTVAAWLSVSVSDWSWRFVATFCALNSPITAVMRAILAGRRLSSILTVCSWILRKVSWELGPSVLCTATGIPSS